MKTLPIIGLLGLAVLGVGCSDNDNTNTPETPETPTVETVSFSVNIINLTAAQPLGPAAVILHKEGYHAWVDGETASVGIETMAEGGDPSVLISEAEAATEHLQSVASAGPIGPGTSQTTEISLDETDGITLSVATMLVNTNDAYTGVNAQDISSLEVGESISINAPAWDAGTEANTEAVGTIPGPADGGEGFNAERLGELDLVTIHRGVISQDDGLDTSVLNQSHRFDNPASRIVITRTQ